MGCCRECKNYCGITLLSVPGKIFAPVFFHGSRSHRRIEQSGFTAGRSTVDRILTLNLLIQTRMEFCQLLWIAFVDRKAAFDSVDRSVFWRQLLSLFHPKDSQYDERFVHQHSQCGACTVMVCSHNGSRSIQELDMDVESPLTCSLHQWIWLRIKHVTVVRSGNPW